MPARLPNARLWHQISDWCSGAAANFDWMREAKRKNTRTASNALSKRQRVERTRYAPSYRESGSDRLVGGPF